MAKKEIRKWKKDVKKLNKLSLPRDEFLRIIKRDFIGIKVDDLQEKKPTTTTTSTDEFTKHNYVTITGRKNLRKLISFEMKKLQEEKKELDNAKTRESN